MHSSSSKKSRRKRGQHDEHTRTGFIRTVMPEGVPLTQLTKYSRVLCLWRSLCLNPRHVLCKQVQSITRHARTRDCRVCAELWHRRSNFEALLYKILEDLAFLGLYAVECHLLEGLALGCTAQKNSLRRHAVDVLLVGLGKVLIELDGQQHTGKSYHGESVQGGLPKMLLLMLLQLQRVGGSFASPLGKTSGWQKPKEPF